MKNNLTGIIISALLHLGVLGWIVSSESIKQPPLINTVALTVSMFQAEVVPVAPAPPVIKKIKKTPEPIKVAALAPTPRIKIKPVEKKPKNNTKKKSVKPTKAKPTAKRIKPKKIVRVVKKKNLTKRVTKKRKVNKPIQHRSRPKVIQQKNVKRLAPVKKKQYKKPRHKVAVKTQTRSRPVSRTNKPTNKRQYTQHRKTHVKPTSRHSKPQSRQYAKKAVAPHRRSIPNPKVSTRTVVAKPSQSVALTKQYKARLQQLIASNKRYPKRAKRRGHQGSVTLSFKVTHSGNIMDIKIIKGANNNDLNNAAIKAIQQSSGKLAYTKGMSKQSLTLTITLTYILS